MHKGKIIACSAPQTLKQNYAYKVLELQADSKNIKQLLTGIALLDINAFGDKYHLVSDNPGQAIHAVQAALSKAGVSINILREIPPSLEDVFVALANEVI